MIQTNRGQYSSPVVELYTINLKRAIAASFDDYNPEGLDHN